MLICWLCDKTRRIFVGERRKKEKKTGVEEEIPGLQEGVGGEGGGGQWRRANPLWLPHPSVTPDMQQNYVLLFCSS